MRLLRAYNSLGLVCQANPQVRVLQPSLQNPKKNKKVFIESSEGIIHSLHLDSRRRPQRRSTDPTYVRIPRARVATSRDSGGRARDLLGQQWEPKTHGPGLRQHERAGQASSAGAENTVCFVHVHSVLVGKAVWACFRRQLLVCWSKSLGMFGL